MNLGQLLETHLGLAANAGGYRAATPALNGITEDQIKEELRKYGFTTDGKILIFIQITPDLSIVQFAVLGGFGSKQALKIRVRR